VIEPSGLNALLYVLTGMSAGLLGSILGLGGGVVMVPVMTILLGVPAHVAVAASLIGVVATSVSSSAGYMKRRLPLVRIGLHLELTTLIGAVAGSIAAGYLADDVIGALFSLLLFYTAWTMWRGRKIRDAADDPDSVVATPLALAGSGAAGCISGVLGVGGGVMKVPVLNVLLGAPIHRSTSTSTFMMGLTAVAGSVAYYLRGELLIELAAPLVLGVLIGGRLGPRIAVRIDALGIKRTFAIVLVVVAIRMSWGLFS
jgi:uncharacterized membrane protein YfcA